MSAFDLAGAARTTAATLVLTTVLAAGAAAAAKPPLLSTNDIVGTWTYTKDNRTGTVTFSMDGTFEQSVPPRAPLEGRWEIKRNALIWAYMLSEANRDDDQRALIVDIVTEATPDRLVLREQTRRTQTTLVRSKPAASSAATPPATGRPLLTVVGLAVLAAAALAGTLYLFRRSRRRDLDMDVPVAISRPRPATTTATTTNAAAEPSDELAAAIGEAVKHGMEMIQATGGPLRPFLFQWTGEERRQSVLMGESMEDSVAMGKELARDMGAEVDGCVIAWDGYVTLGGDRSDTLFFHAYERGDAASHILVQRYERSPTAHFRAKGNVALIRQDMPLFASMAKRTRPTWGPFVKLSRADVRNIVTRDPATGLEQLHFIITVEQLEHAGDAILDTFDSVRAGYTENAQFGGEMLFVVHGPSAPGPELAPELARTKALLDERIAREGLKTAKGHPFRVKVEQRKSVF